MGKDKDESYSEFELEGTRVDLGDDLLEATIHTRAPLEKISPDKEDDLTELFHSAEILKQEGLIDDAKSLLRKILRQNSKDVAARKLLEEIHQSELKHILETPDTQPSSKSSSQEESTEETVRDLEELLRVDLHSPSSEDEIFQSAESKKDFLAQVEKQFRSASAQDRLDIGIAFLSMNCLEFAITQFQSIIRNSNSSSSDTLQRGVIFSAVSLLASTYLSLGRYMDSLTLLEPLYRDQDWLEEQVLDLKYLMARSYEGLGRREESKGFFQSLLKSDPSYRDVQERLSHLE